MFFSVLISKNILQVPKAAGITKHIVRFTSTIQVRDPGPAQSTTRKLLQPLQEKLSGWTVQLNSNGSIAIESVIVKVEGDEDDQKHVHVSWTNQDEDLGSYILGFLQTMLN